MADQSDENFREYVRQIQERLDEARRKFPDNIAKIEQILAGLDPLAPYPRLKKLDAETIAKITVEWEEERAKALANLQQLQADTKARIDALKARHGKK